MSPLRQQMTADMQLRGLAQRTQKAYLGVVEQLAEYYHQSPAHLSQNQIQCYLLHLIEERKLAWSSTNQAACALRFLYHITLHQPATRCCIPARKATAKLPEILSPDEVSRLLDACLLLKHRALLMTTYAAGLRVSETCALKLSDIDSERMMLRIEGGKGGPCRVADAAIALQPSLCASLCQGIDELRAEHVRQRLDREQEAAATANPLSLRRQRAAGNQGMHVQVPHQVLRPGMQHQRERQPAAQPARVGAEGGQCRGGRREQDVGDAAEVMAGQAIERMRDGKDQVRIGHRQQLPMSGGDPLFLRAGLAARAVAVAAGVIDVSRRAAGSAPVDVTAQRCSTAGHNGTPCLRLRTGERRRGKIALPVLAEDIGQFGPAAASHALTSGRQRREQVQRRVGLCLLLPQMQIPCSGGDLVMAHESADGVNVHARFQKMRGKRVTQTVNAALLVDAGAPLGAVKRFLYVRYIEWAAAVAPGK
jgi:hypothetical protein